MAPSDVQQEPSISARNDERKISPPPMQTAVADAGLLEPQRTVAIAAVLAAMVLVVGVALFTPHLQRTA
ncbi:MAG: hypothetical protein IPI03_01555 [Rubrivivax sp.]|jgi:hypothetical protein|nr:hypothetical protein [Rubrivivax sp.]MBK8526308.1 hypothetical protein [Rubrivivax sp.]